MLNLEAYQRERGQGTVVGFENMHFNKVITLHCIECSRVINEN